MKKILLGIALTAISMLARAQNGLESIIVEKYYVSTAADSIGSTGVLPVGSVTYRIFADLLPGYNFQALYGVAGHTLLVQTSTKFFNNENYGGTTPSISATNVRKESSILDSYFSVGGAAGGKMGVLKAEDTDGSPGNAQSIIQNNNATMGGIAVNIGSTASVVAQDGMIAGAPVAVTYVGINNTGNGDLGVLDGTSQVGGLFTTSNGSVAALGGATGPLANNKVLIGQFTTNGIFHFELNVQIGTPGSGTQQFVANGPVGTEISIASLTGTYGPNVLPNVAMTAPASQSTYITGAVVAMAATATDADGIISQVDFRVNGVSVGIDNTAPYTMNWTSTVGTKYLTAVATDNDGGVKTSLNDTIIVGNNPPPTCTITAPLNGANFSAGATVNISATATDDVSVTQVEFKVDNISVGIDNTSPYTGVYSPAVTGGHTITATATDNLGATTVSTITISVGANQAPTCSITSPSNGATFYAGTNLTVTSTASDPDGTIAAVYFYVNGVLVGSHVSLPYNFGWTAVTGTAVLTVRALDNLGTSTYSSPVTITILDPAANKYKIVTTAATCVSGIFCEPIAAYDSVANVIGYDIVLHYNKTKVLPTGNVTVYNALVNPSYVDVATSMDTAAGNVYVSLYFNSSAPPNTRFNGTGNLCCFEFSKTSNFASVDTAIFNIISLQESYFTGTVVEAVENGNYFTYKDTTFNGSLIFWADNSALKYNTAVPAQYLVTNIYGNNVTCTSKSAIAVRPDLSGNFIYSTNNGLDVNIERDIIGTTSVQPVVNGFDAFLTRKVLINDITLIPSVYQIIAMDVNRDGVVSAGDLSQINQRAVLLIPEYKQAWNYDTAGVSNGSPSKDWQFIDATTLATSAAYRISTTYPNSDATGYSKSRVPVIPFCLVLPITNSGTCPLVSSETYKGIMMGDINGNFATVGSGGFFRTNSGDKVIFDMTKAVISGSFIDIPVSVLSFENVNALDFAMQYNESNLTFNAVVDHTNYLQQISNYNADDKTLRFTSNSLQNYDVNKSLVSVRFNTNGVTVSEADFSSLTAYLNGEQVNVELRTAATALNNETMISIYPNPTNGMLNVEVADDANIQLLGMDGQVIMETTVYANQKHEMNIDNLANGIYMMKIYNSNFVSMKKVIVQR